MDLAHIELEFDNLNKYGVEGKIPQEIAKNPALPGGNVLSPHPEGINPQLMQKKKERAFKAVENETTQVVYRGKES